MSTYYPFQWRETAAELYCSICGARIPLERWGNHGDWDTLERMAAVISARSKHVCPATTDQLQHASQKMKQLRSEKQMSFEEECIAYNEIMRNQTYLDEL